MSDNSKIFIINGPNLNLLGKREPEHYGNKTLNDIKENCMKYVAKKNIELIFEQSNDESVIIEMIQDASDSDGIIINAGAYTHTSIAIHDALKSSNSPAIEVHLSNIHKREEFRHKSYISGVVDGIIIGLGDQGYILAIDAVTKIMNERVS
ncbi:MAG: type II 3-dehydroquinate dehydratase [Pseudomonadota bacterium]|jgi:3-dehydroquinate dehydratase-2|nr:type II 3-dehydroquinate dehydratase [Pseudomonadota bacterium]